MKRAGAGTPSANRITLLRDADGDGVAETRSVFLERPATRRSAWRWSATTSTSPTPTRSCASRTSRAQTRIDARRREGRRPARRAAQPPLDQERDRQHRRQQALRDRRLEQQRRRERHGGRGRPRRDLGDRPRSGAARVFATGLRNPNGMALGAGDAARSGPSSTSATSSAATWCPTTSPRCATARFYGWPYSYYGQHVDERVQPPRPDLVAEAIAPDYALGPHTASLGLASSAGATLPAPFGERHVRRPARLVEPQARTAATR